MRKLALLGSMVVLATATQAQTPPSGSLDASLGLYDRDVRRTVDRAMLRAFREGGSIPWYSWTANGFVSVSEPVQRGGAVCRNVSVTFDNWGRLEPIAEGLRCIEDGGWRTGPIG